MAGSSGASVPQVMTKSKIVATGKLRAYHARMIDWATVPTTCRVPVASFFDLPRKIKKPAPEGCAACGGERAENASRSCQRCYKRGARESFAERWSGRFPDGPTAGEALAETVAPHRNSRSLDQAFDDALARDSDIEKFRALAGIYGGSDFIRGRDERAALLGKPGKTRSDAPRRPMKRAVYADGAPKATAAEVRRLLSRPRAGGYMWFTNTTWSDRDNYEIAILADGGVSLERAAIALARSPSSVAHRAHDTGLKMPLDWRLTIAAPKIIRPAPRVAAYPFIQGPKRDEHALLLKVNEFIPHCVPGREDACQALMLALLEGTILPDALMGKQGDKNRRAFMAAMRKENFEMSGYAVDLDEPLRDKYGAEEPGLTLMGLI
jgi:hypothetical protein